MDVPAPRDRQSARLANFDYASTGAYFITICAHQRNTLFGAIVDGRLVTSVIGTIVVNCWNSIPHHFSHVSLDSFVVMPNHLHGIIILGEQPPPNVRAQHAAPLQRRLPRVQQGSVGAIIRSFKSAATKAVNDQRLTTGTPVWQRNYHERVIRNDDELNRIRQYIADNPKNWSIDSENPNRTIAVS